MRAGWASVVCVLLLGTAARAQETARTVAVVTENDIVFARADERMLQLDLARPEEGEGPFPAVLLLHDGGWIDGSRKQFAQTLAALAGRGYVVVAPDYRLAPQARFPAQLHDCKAAVRWLRANAGKYHIDPDRIGVVGFSAGGHLACLVGLVRPEDGLEGDGGNQQQSSRVQAVVSFFGPTDLTSNDWSPIAEKTNLIPLLGGSREQVPEAYRRASPISYAGRVGAPAFLFLHGSEDRVVRPEQSQRLADKVRGGGGLCRVVTIEGAGHGWKGPALTRSIEQTIQFLDGQLKQ
jgi:acetyl esterase/lipase